MWPRFDGLWQRRQPEFIKKLVVFFGFCRDFLFQQHQSGIHMAQINLFFRY